MTTCCCCGVALEFDEAEEVMVGMEGSTDFMCGRCFREDCDCLEPELMFVLEQYEEDDSPEAWEGVEG